jgi:hypothetical protein
MQYAYGVMNISMALQCQHRLTQMEMERNQYRNSKFPRGSALAVLHVSPHSVKSSTDPRHNRGKNYFFDPTAPR